MYQFILATCYAIFGEKKYCRLQLGYARRVFKNVSGILIMSYCDWFLSSQKIEKQVAVGVSHAATCRVTLRKVEAASVLTQYIMKSLYHNVWKL